MRNTRIGCNNKMWLEEKKKFSSVATKPTEEDCTSTEAAVSSNRECARKRKPHDQDRNEKWDSSGQTEEEYHQAKKFLLDNQHSPTVPNLQPKITSMNNIKIVKNYEIWLRNIIHEAIGKAVREAEENNIITEAWREYSERVADRREQGEAFKDALEDKNSSSMDIEMEEIELVVRGTKRKAFKKIKEEEKKRRKKESQTAAAELAIKTQPSIAALWGGTRVIKKALRPSRKPRQLTPTKLTSVVELWCTNTNKQRGLKRKVFMPKAPTPKAAKLCTCKCQQGMCKEKEAT